MSGVEFELVGVGYRVSLVKRRFVSGKARHSISSPVHIDSFRQLCVSISRNAFNF